MASPVRRADAGSNAAALRAGAVLLGGHVVRWGEEGRIPHPRVVALPKAWPNKGVQATANSVRSCLAPLDILVTRAATMPSPMSMVGFFHVHGAASRVHANETAFGLRDDQWDYDIISQWLNPEESAHHMQWTREFWTAVEPFATGEVYVNHLDAEEATRIRAAYSAATTNGSSP